MEGFRAIFQGVGDPRKSNATRHGLIEMLAVALPATLSGSSSCSGFARYAEHKQEFLREFMELKGGPPSHDAFSDVSDALDPEQLSGAMTDFAKTLAAALPRDRAAVDGKALRGAIMDAKKKSALHPVQAFEPRAGLVLGQAEVDGKSNETAAVPALPDLDGRTAAADAMHTQRETSARIVEKGGDCVLPAKGDQGTLHEDVQVRFSDPEAQKEMLECRHVGGGHGRVETRVATVSHDVGWLQDLRSKRRQPARLARPQGRRQDRGRPRAEGQDGAGRPHLHHERGDSSGAAAGTHAQPLEDRELPPLGSGRRHGRGSNAEPNAERAGMPRRHPAHRPGHRAPHGRRALARGTDGHRRLERQISGRPVRERGRQILKAKALSNGVHPAFLGWRRARCGKSKAGRRSARRQMPPRRLALA